MRFFRPIVNLVGINFVAVFFYFVLVELEEKIIAALVIPQINMTLEEWIADFRQLALIGIGAAWVTSIIWYVMTQLGFKVNRIKSTTARHVWFLLFLFPVIAVVISILLTPQSQEGDWVPKVFHLVNGIFSYYLATVLFSPSAFKYTPPGAKFFRHW